MLFKLRRLQLAGGKERYGNMLNTYAVILKEEGFGALYKGKDDRFFCIWDYILNCISGAVPRMVVVGPLFGITLLAFEFQKEYMIKKGLLWIRIVQYMKPILDGVYVMR